MIYRLLISVDGDLRRFGYFVGIVHASEVLDLPGEGFGIHTFHVAIRAHLERRINEDLNKVGCLLAYLLAGFLVRRDERSDHAYAIAREQLGNERHTLDVLIAIFLAEAEIARQSFADGIAIQSFVANAARAQFFFDCQRDSRLARAGESGQPECEAFSLVWLVGQRQFLLVSFL